MLALQVRTFAAYRVADIGRIVGAEITTSRLLPVVTRLSEDAAEPVRAALASVILALAPLLGQAATVELLLPVFLRLLKDTSAQVRLNIISKLEAVNAVIGLRILSQSLLPAISELSSDKQWRVRAAIIDFMPLLARQLGADFFDTELVSGGRIMMAAGVVGDHDGRSSCTMDADDLPPSSPFRSLLPRPPCRRACALSGCRTPSPPSARPRRSTCGSLPVSLVPHGPRRRSCRR